jgi:hypothetical protein
MGGVVGGFFATEVSEGDLQFPCGAAGFLLEHMGHEEAGGVSDRWGLAELLVAAGQDVVAGADQVAAEGVDELGADRGW